jgi:GDP-L-fucose synthase
MHEKETAMVGKEMRIYVAGANGMVGSALVRRLNLGGYPNILTPNRLSLNLLDSKAVNAWMAEYRPEYIFMAAAKVGGINANNILRADFLYENLMIEANLINAAHLADIQNLMFLGSSCIYPRDCPQPIKEDYLLTGSLELTNEPYAIAKIAGIKLVEAYNYQYGRKYTSIMPTNLFGPNDNYDLNTSHVLPALIRKAHDARIKNDGAFTVWGTGTPRREFLYVDDLADACVHLMEQSYEGPLVNIGTGKDLTISELASIIAEVVGFKGDVLFDSSKPDGTPQKLLDVSRLKSLGWTAQTTLRDGIAKAYRAAPFYE